MSNIIKESLQDIISDITKSYEDFPVSQSQFNRALPVKMVIFEITEGLLEIVFPGYFGDGSPDNATLQYHVGNALLKIARPLQKQIELSFGGGNTSNAPQDAENICLSFFLTLPKLRKLLSYDVQAALVGDPAAADEDMIIFCYPGLYAIAVYRIAHELLKLGVPLIPRIMTEYAHSKTGIDIHPGAQIGEYFFIDHGTGVVIGETTIIGNNVKIYQGVTLGGLSTKDGRGLIGVKRHPTIEDNVTIYSGATVLGGETIIGKNVTIGGNAFITESKYKSKH